MLTCLKLDLLENYKAMVIMSSAYSFNLLEINRDGYLSSFRVPQSISGVSLQVLCCICNCTDGGKACDQLRACAALNENVPTGSDISTLGPQLIALFGEAQEL